MGITIIFTALLALTSCATMMDQTPKGPLAWRYGFMDGCDSGYVAAGNPYYKFNKDHERYLNDPLYKSGWDDGFATCKGKYDSIRLR